MKLRVIESIDGLFYPQFKQFFFSPWRFYLADSDTRDFMLLWLIPTNDPEDAAKFKTNAEAIDFMKRVERNVKRKIAEKRATAQRVSRGIKAKRKIMVEK